MSTTIVTSIITTNTIVNDHEHYRQSPSSTSSTTNINQFHHHMTLLHISLQHQQLPSSHISPLPLLITSTKHHHNYISYPSSLVNINVSLFILIFHYFVFNNIYILTFTKVDNSRCKLLNWYILVNSKPLFCKFSQNIWHILWAKMDISLNFLFDPLSEKFYWKT